MSLTCSRCRLSPPDGARFCPTCGAPVTPPQGSASPRRGTRRTLVVGIGAVLILMSVGLAVLVGSGSGDEDQGTSLASVSEQSDAAITTERLIGRWRSVEPFHTWSITEQKIANGATFQIDLGAGGRCIVSGYSYASVPAGQNSGEACRYSLRAGPQLVIELDGKEHVQEIAWRGDGSMAVTAASRTALLRKMLLDGRPIQRCHRALQDAAPHEPATGSRAYREALRTVAADCAAVRLDVAMLGDGEQGCLRANDIHLMLGTMMSDISVKARQRARAERSIGGDLKEEDDAMTAVGGLYRSSLQWVYDLC